jgi:hypothetical protein
MAKTKKKKTKKSKPKKSVKKVKAIDITLQMHKDGGEILSYEVNTWFETKELIHMLTEVAKDLKKKNRSRK